MGVVAMVLFKWAVDALDWRTHRHYRRTLRANRRHVHRRLRGVRYAGLTHA